MGSDNRRDQPGGKGCVMATFARLMRAKIIAGMKSAKRRKRSGTGKQRVAPGLERGKIIF